MLARRERPTAARQVSRQAGGLPRGGGNRTGSVLDRATILPRFSFLAIRACLLVMNCMSISAGANCFRRWGFALAVLALAGATAGCVERRMTIRSNPPGAQVYVDDYEIGTAPASTSYIYYGTRKIRLVKDGYETLTVYQPMPAPWYGWPGIDFFSENLWPHEIRDERSFEYQLSPMIIVPTEELKARAEQLRSASQVVPAGLAQPIAAPPAASQPAIVQPQELPPPVMGPPQSTVVTPQNAMPPNAAPNFAAPPSNSYPPPGGYPAPSPYPGPSYPAPGTAPTNTPSNAPMFNQPPLPPGWRPIGEAETGTILR
jgi:PEGA domain